MKTYKDFYLVALLMAIVPSVIAGCNSGSDGSGARIESDTAGASVNQFSGCTDESESFIAGYTGDFVDNDDPAQRSTAITIGADGSFTLQEMRQVGGNPMIPSVSYPTNCSLLEQGEIIGVYDEVSASGSSASQCPFDDFFSSVTPSERILYFHVNHVTVNTVLVTGPDTSAAGCQDFADAVNSNPQFQDYPVPISLVSASSFRFMDNGSGADAGELMTQSP